MVSRPAGALVLGSLAFLAPQADAGVTILGKPGSYSTIQAAVDAALDGDVLLIESGTYPPFMIVDKSLSVFALTNGAVTVSNGGGTVQQLAAHRTVVLVGLNLKGKQGQTNMQPGGPGLNLTANAGHVVVQSCFLEGGLPQHTSTNLQGGAGLLALDCPRVVVTHSHLDGRSIGLKSGYGPSHGGHGLESNDSIIALYDSQVHGGSGSDESFPAGGHGGIGFRVQGWGCFASGSEIRGGRGGAGDGIACTVGGNGGHGLAVIDTQAVLLETSTSGGLHNYGVCGPGTSGLPIYRQNCTLTNLTGPARSLDGPPQTTDNASVQFLVSGAPGDSVWLLRASRPEFKFAMAFNGVICVPMPWRLPVVAGGTVGVGGNVTLTWTISDLVGPEAGWVWSLQALCAEVGGGTFLSSPLQLLIHNT